LAPYLILICRDLGELVRRRIASSFPLGESSRINVEEWTKIVAHLDSISSNQALQKFPRKLKSSATGLSVVECKEVVSTDFLNKLKEQESKGFFKA